MPHDPSCRHAAGIAWRWLVACATLCGAAAGQEVAAGRDTARGDVEPFVLHSVQAVGDVVGENLRVKIELRAESASDELVRIPLRFDEAILIERSTTGDGPADVKDEGPRGGYAWYIRGKSRPWQLTLQALVPLRVAAGETQLRLAFPQAQQAVSELKLRIPGDVAIGELLGGEQREEPERRDGRTEYTFRRLAGPVSISWYPRGQVLRESGKLRARTFVRTQYDAAAREFHSDARITVFSAGGTFSEFQVRLPPGATLIEDDPRRLTVERASDGRGDVVKVKHEPASRYSLGLSLTHPYDPGAKPLELAKYEVVGAVRQWGYLSLEVDETYQPRWGTLDPQHVARIAVADLPREFLEELKVVPGDIDAAFEVFSAQASLPMACSRSKPRVRVEPDQVVFVEGDRLRLEAVLRYTTDRPISQVQFELPPGDDWQDVKVDSIPTQLVQQPVTVDPAPPGRGAAGRKQVTVDLKSAAGNSFTLRVTALKKQPAEPGDVTFGVLQIAGQVATGRLWVQPADEVSLTPLASPTGGKPKDKEKAKGSDAKASDAKASETKANDAKSNDAKAKDAKPLEKKSDKEIVALSLLEPAPALPEGIERQGFKQPPSCYRVESFGAIFAARVGSHPQRLTLSSEADLSVESGKVRVQQRLRGDLENRPLTELTLLVPEELNGSVQVTLEGKTLTLLDDKAVGTTPADARRKHLQFPTPLRPGKFVLQLSYQHPWAPESQEGPGRQRVRVPLVTPEQWREGRLSLIAKDGFSARVGGATDEGWRPAEEPGTVADAPQRFQAARPVSEAVLDVLWAAPVVQRLWLDSWLFREKRIDRLVCEFTSERHPLRIQLPAGAADSLQATLDAKPLGLINIDSNNVLKISPSRTARTLELRYEVPMESTGVTARLDPARPTDDVWVRETHWQLLLPETRHLLWSPADVQREFSWQWQGWSWGRVNDGAPQGIPGEEQELPRGVNAYLFSTLGPPPVVRVATVDRTWLVVVASGLAFLAGGLLLKLPSLRRREVFFAAAVLLVAAGLLYPEPFLLVAQAGSLGVAAILVVWGLKALFAVYRPFLKAGPSGSTLTSSGVFRGSSAPTRLTPNRAASVGSSRAATISSQQAAAHPAVPAAAAEGASAGSSRPSEAMVTSQGT